WSSARAPVGRSDASDSALAPRTKSLRDALIFIVRFPVIESFGWIESSDRRLVGRPDGECGGVGDGFLVPSSADNLANRTISHEVRILALVSGGARLHGQAVARSRCRVLESHGLGAHHDRRGIADLRQRSAGPATPNELVADANGDLAPGDMLDRP